MNISRLLGSRVSAAKTPILARIQDPRRPGVATAVLAWLTRPATPGQPCPFPWANKKGGLSVEEPASRFDGGRRFDRPLASAQAGDVIGHRADLAVVQLGGDLRHLRAVLADAVAEGDQLACRVVGMLAGDARVLRRDAGAVRAVAAGAGRQRAALHAA